MHASISKRSFLIVPLPAFSFTDTHSLPQGSFVRGFAPEFDEVAVVRVRASVRLVIRVAVDFLLGAAQAKAAVFLLKFGKALANKTPFNAPVNFIAR